ncbi:MAG: hypothetical protein KDA61_22615, partial [Planctomycetales bacterium]|nr:hypothetical protein [Planctomycetales bacterium]
KLAGKLARFRGAIIGQFTKPFDREDDEAEADPRYSLDGVINQYFADAPYPVLVNFPVGHFAQNAALPLGGQVEIDADKAVLRVLPRPSAR